MDSDSELVDMGAEQLITLISHISRTPKHEIKMTNSIGNDLDLDSLDVAQLAVALVDTYGLEARSQLVFEMNWNRTTVQDLHEFCCRHSRLEHRGRMK